MAQQPLDICYKGQLLTKHYCPDLICFDKVVVEIKAIKQLTSADEGQLLNYLKASGKTVGVLINFGSPRLEWKRMVFTPSNSSGMKD